MFTFASAGANVIDILLRYRNIYDFFS